MPTAKKSRAAGYARRAYNFRNLKAGAIRREVKKQLNKNAESKYIEDVTSYGTRTLDVAITTATGWHMCNIATGTGPSNRVGYRVQPVHLSMRYNLTHDETTSPPGRLGFPVRVIIVCWLDEGQPQLGDLVLYSVGRGVNLPIRPDFYADKRGYILVDRMHWVGQDKSEVCSKVELKQSDMKSIIQWDGVNGNNYMRGHLFAFFIAEDSRNTGKMPYLEFQSWLYYKDQ